jgi:hypothetical protein
MRPRYGVASRFVTSACRGCSGSYDGAGMCRFNTSKRGSRSVPSSAGSSEAVPARAFAYTMGNSIWCSSASRSRKRP